MIPARALVLIGLLLPARVYGFAWPSTIEQTTRELGSQNAATRRLAARRVSTFPLSVQRRLVPLLLADADTGVRLLGAARAIDLELPVAKQVIPWLTEPEVAVRSAAVDVLSVSPDEAAAPHLARALNDAEPIVRALAARALVVTRDADAALVLLGHLDDADPRVRENVLDGLAELRDPRTALALMSKVQDTRASVRSGVIRVLGKLGNPRTASALMLALRDSEAEVKIAALTALAELRSTESVTAIAQLLRSSQQSGVTEAAYFALARIQTPQALALLAEAVTADDADRALLAERAFAGVGVAALEPLARCLSGQPSQRQAEGCVSALGYIQDPAAERWIVAALERRLVPPVVAFDALLRVGAKQSLEPVLESLNSPDQVVRRTAMRVVASELDPSAPDGRVVEPIARALAAASDDREERVRLIQLLGLSGAPRAATPILPFLAADQDGATRLAAIEALGRLGNGGQAPWLLSVSTDTSSELRWAAVIALRRIADPSLDVPILTRIESAAEQDRGALVSALGGALAATTDQATLDRIARLIRSSNGMQRDALIEAAGYVPGKAGSDLLLSAATSADFAAQAKVAEALVTHPEAKSALLKLGRSRDDAVRANVMWALTGVGAAGDVAYLREALDDPDPRVAANATAALARLAASVPNVVGILCATLSHPGAFVRANALAGLRLSKTRCGANPERGLLASDTSSLVRRAAARLLLEVPLATDRDALERCAVEDSSGDVAQACLQESARTPSQHTTKVTVFVVADGDETPKPRGAFALMRSDGLIRLGQTDRRGAVFEAYAPDGPLRLEPPNFSGD